MFKEVQNGRHNIQKEVQVKFDRSKAAETLEKLLDLHTLQGKLIAQLADFIEPSLLDVDI